MGLKTAVLFPAPLLVVRRGKERHHLKNNSRKENVSNIYLGDEGEGEWEGHPREDRNRKESYVPPWVGGIRV
jgi:hypothetical protein